MGIPRVLLELETSEAVGQIVVRLCEVAPDGRSRRLSWGARNLTLSDDFSVRRSPQATLSIEIPLFGLADSIGQGSRLRLAVSTSYWPMLWPAAKSGRVTLHTGRCRVLLPVRAQRNGDSVTMPAPEAAPTCTWTSLRTGRYGRHEGLDRATGEHVLSITEDMGTGRIQEIGLAIGECTTRTFRIRPDDPTSATLETQVTCSFERDQWRAETSVRGRITADDASISTVHELEAKEGERTVYAREWRDSVPSR